MMIVCNELEKKRYFADRRSPADVDHDREKSQPYIGLALD